MLSTIGVEYVARNGLCKSLPCKTLRVSPIKAVWVSKKIKSVVKSNILSSSLRDGIPIPVLEVKSLNPLYTQEIPNNLIKSS